MCTRTLICGHKCKKLCAEECSIQKCKELVLQKKSTLACGHNNVWVLCRDRDKGIYLNRYFYHNDIFLLNFNTNILLQLIIILNVFKISKHLFLFF